MTQQEKNEVQSRKKVLFVITKATAGGAQRYVSDLVTGLSSEIEPSVAYGVAGELSESLKTEGVALYPTPSLGRDIALFADIRSFFSLLSLMRRLRPDVVHLNSSKAAGLGALAARLQGVRRVVFTVHGWPFEEKRSPFFRALIYLASWCTAALSHVVIVVSKRDLESGLRMPVVKKRVHLVASGRGASTFMTRDEARNTLLPDVAHRHEKDLWVVTIAEMHANKNLFTAIDAIARYNESHLPRIFYCIIGDGELRQRLKEHLTRRGMRETVALPGFVHEPARFLKAFDVFFLPSRKEGLPYVLLEAAGAELPVVASDIGGIPDIVRDGEGGLLCPPDDTACFSDALYKLAKDSEKRIALGEALHFRTKREFSLPNMLTQTLALYDQIAPTSSS